MTCLEIKVDVAHAPRTQRFFSLQKQGCFKSYGRIPDAASGRDERNDLALSGGRFVRSYRFGFNRARLLSYYIGYFLERASSGNPISTSGLDQTFVIFRSNVTRH